MQKQKLFNHFSKIILSLLFFLLVLTVPSQAQPNFNNWSSAPIITDSWQIFQSNEVTTKTAPVVLDGRELFRVSASGGYAAIERADWIATQLQVAVDSNKSSELTIETRNQLPVIFLNGEQLLTVTNQDSFKGAILQERAQFWSEKIQQAIEQAQLERTSNYLQQQLSVSFFILLIALILSRFIKQLETYPVREAIQRIIPGIAKRNRTKSSNLTTLYRLKLGLIQFILWVSVFLIITEFFPLLRSWRYKFLNLLIGSMTNSWFNLGDKSYSFLNLLILTALFWGLIILSGNLTTLLRTRILQATRMNRGSQEVISTILKYSLISIGTIVLLQIWGLNLSSLALIGSALGVGIGFGFQEIAKNFASGLVLLFERSVQVGDFIQVGQHLGTVERIGARSIVLKTLDKISIIVPNSRLLADEVTNWSHDNPASRLHLPVGVAYGSDVEKVKTALLRVAEEHPEVLRYPQPQVFFNSFGESWLDFELLVWTSDPSRQVRLKSDLYFQIEKIFKQQEIKIPFPQRDLHLQNANLPITLSPQLENYLLHFLKSFASQQSRNGKR
ncbi:MscS Mechanosensitive ion channel [Stanieria cyanosphaera PCC 7437]|uniref:MscS Mechanosensitive ion channel n=1 Tax=Stanieria cyanosphaera (strain ATCC 29371 / PCC 7437) TaxID=111780 RepID=K9XVS7_STAC7|nr:mechanosensitive ion channel domain-containing protein [Stanieria cyanosphaera]AFZ36695.1 MscS Mechanosensitive ion channel [Stanieria cyanosphaera PCC 7437]